MADVDDPIAVELRRTGWRQGDLIQSNTDVATLLSKSVDFCRVTASSDIWLIVLTQDCDSLRECTLEPYIELIAARVANKHNRQLETGESSRRLQVRVRTVTDVIFLECSIHDRFRVPKANVSRITRQTEANLEENARRHLRQWVARRYTRRPFPDEFENRFSPRSGPIRDIFKKPAAKLISVVYIATSEEELSSEVPYEVDMLLVARDHDLVDQEFRGPIDDFEEEVLKTIEAQSGIVFAKDKLGNPMMRVIGEDQLTLGMIRRYKRFDADYRSSHENEVAPPDGVDEA